MTGVYPKRNVLVVLNEDTGNQGRVMKKDLQKVLLVEAAPEPVEIPTPCIFQPEIVICEPMMFVVEEAPEEGEAEEEILEKELVDKEAFQDQLEAMIEDDDELNQKFQQKLEAMIDIDEDLDAKEEDLEVLKQVAETHLDEEDAKEEVEINYEEESAL